MAKNTAKARNVANKLTVSISRPFVEIDELPVRYQDTFELGFGPIGPKELKKALVDSEVFTSLLREQPKEVAAIVNHVLAGRKEAARETAMRIGLTEESFQKKGGGFLFWAGIALFAGFILVYAATNPPPQ